MTQAVENFSQQLHDIVVNTIEERGIGRDELAEMIHIFPDCAQSLLNYDKWPVSRGFQVLEALGVEIDITFHPAQT